MNEWMPYKSILLLNKNFSLLTTPHFATIRWSNQFAQRRWCGVRWSASVRTNATRCSRCRRAQTLRRTHAARPRDLTFARRRRPAQTLSSALRFVSFSKTRTRGHDLTLVRPLTSLRCTSIQAFIWDNLAWLTTGWASIRHVLLVLVRKGEGRTLSLVVMRRPKTTHNPHPALDTS